MNALAFASFMINKKESLEMSPSSYTPFFKGRFVSALLSPPSGIRRFFALAAAAAFLGSTAQAAPVNLSSWVAEGAGTWTLAPNHLSVEQTQNGTPTVFYSPNASSIGTSLSGTITPSSTSADNDFIGLVIGFQPGDLTAPTTDYILIDWKKGTQALGGCTGNAGLSISRVTAAWTQDGFWCHSSSEINELARAITLGSTGWVHDVSYDFRVDFSSSQIDVYVNGTLELSITGTFSDGRFGFYNYSQDLVTYSGITQTAIAPQAIPVNQTTWMLIFGIGLFALYGIRRRSKKA